MIPISSTGPSAFPSSLPTNSLKFQFIFALASSLCLPSFLISSSPPSFHPTLNPNGFDACAKDVNLAAKLSSLPPSLHSSFHQKEEGVEDGREMKGAHAHPYPCRISPSCFSPPPHLPPFIVVVVIVVKTKTRTLKMCLFAWVSMWVLSLSLFLSLFVHVFFCFPHAHVIALLRASPKPM